MTTHAHLRWLEEKKRLAQLLSLTVDQITKLRKDYISQKHSCNKKFDLNKNKVDMKLTFEEWLTIWVNSGKLPQRGKRVGEYCMCRNNDIGHYEIGNVFIDLASKNSSMAPIGIRSEEVRQKLRSQYKGKPRPKEVWDKVRETKIKNGTYKSVINDNDNCRFITVAAAARHYKLDGSTITRYCKLNLKGFRFEKTQVL